MKRGRNKKTDFFFGKGFILLSISSSFGRGREIIHNHSHSSIFSGSGRRGGRNGREEKGRRLRSANRKSRRKGRRGLAGFSFSGILGLHVRMIDFPFSFFVSFFYNGVGWEIVRMKKSARVEMKKEKIEK